MGIDPKSLVETALAAGAEGNTATAMAMFSADVVAHYASSLPFGGDHEGLLAYLGALSELNRLYRLAVEGVEVVAAERDRVLLLFDITYTATDTGFSTRQRSIEVLTFSGATVSDVAVYHGDTSALLTILAKS